MRAAAARRENHEPGAAFYRSMDEVMSLLKQTEDIEVDGMISHGMGQPSR